mgnify:CR=1 FL=1
MTNRNARELVLPAGAVCQLEPHELDDVQIVRSDGGRTVVELPLEGLTIAGQEIEFEGIDFVWPPAGSEAGTGGSLPAMLTLRVGKARFVSCRFRAFGSSETVAIRWQGTIDPSPAGLPTGQLEINRSVLENVTAVQVQTYGAMALRATGTLHLGPGPLVRTSRCLAVDEPLAIALERCTLRGAQAVLDCKYARLERSPGTVTIHTADCVLAGDEGSLLLLRGADSPEPWLPMFSWRGQGSVMQDTLEVLAWQDNAGDGQPIDESRLRIEGLVRSALEFAGPAGAGPAASRLVRCLAPLRSTELPGVQGSSLPNERP